MKTVAAQQGTDAADWSFLHAFAHMEEESEVEGEQGAVYVHPLLKCSSASLSDRSLEMCTELLGNETGGDVGDGGAPLLSPEGGGSNHRPAIWPVIWSGSFPPPLTSVSGSTGVQMRSRREGGKLVVDAVVVSSRRSFFHMEQSHGRLRIHFSEESDALETEAEEEEKEEEEEEVEAGCEEVEEEEENVRVEAQATNRNTKPCWWWLRTSITKGDLDGAKKRGLNRI